MRSNFLKSVLFLVFLNLTTLAQSVENVKAVFKEGQSIITYDLISEDSTQEFSIDLFSSHNSYSSPLVLVSGHVGLKVLGGRGRRIIWDTKDELVSFKGEINFKVKASPFIPPLAFLSPLSGSSIRKNKVMVFQWQGGKPFLPVTLNLYKNGKLLETIGERSENKNYFEWKVPKKIKRGGYTVKIESGLQTTFSSEFFIKSRYPVFYKIAPIALGLAIIVISSSGNSDVVDNDLPNAPSPR